MLKKIPCDKSELELLYSLTGGQCFRWRRSGEGQWTGVFSHLVWTLSQDDHFLYYQVIGHDNKSAEGISNGSVKQNIPVSALPVDTKSRAASQAPNSLRRKKHNKHTNGDTIETEDEDKLFQKLLRNYLRLDHLSLSEYYVKWSESDENFKEASNKFRGIRILAQDPVENVFSFICSSNNNIARISSMVEKLCTLYGKKIVDLDGTPYHDFPTIANLTAPKVEETLREAGFGYRAKFIYRSACKMQELGGSEWLNKLQTLPYAEAKLELMQLPGIGAKVADCICLMSLGHLEAIPVDTHIFQVAAQRYLPHLRACKSVTDRVYNEIGEHFRSLYGEYAGWAHTILFCADLKMFQEPVHENKKGTNSKKRKLKS